MPSLLDEVRMTFTATVWVRRWRGRIYGLPLLWFNLKCVKEDGRFFTTINRLVLLIYVLGLAVTLRLIYTEPYSTATSIACLVMGYWFIVLYYWTCK